MKTSAVFNIAEEGSAKAAFHTVEVGTTSWNKVEVNKLAIVTRLNYIGTLYRVSK